MQRRAIWMPTLSLLLAAAAVAQSTQNKRDTAVREDKQHLVDDESWFYDDLDKALAAAAETKRPLLVVFR